MMPSSCFGGSLPIILSPSFVSSSITSQNAGFSKREQLHTVSKELLNSDLQTNHDCTRKPHPLTEDFLDPLHPSGNILVPRKICLSGSPPIDLSSLLITKFVVQIPRNKKSPNSTGTGRRASTLPIYGSAINTSILAKRGMGCKWTNVPTYSGVNNEK